MKISLIWKPIYNGTEAKEARPLVYRQAAWYDNEWGFSNRMLDLTRRIDCVRKA